MYKEATFKHLEVYKDRFVKKPYVNRFINLFISAKIHPTHLTFLAFLFGLISGVFLFNNHILFVLFVLSHYIIDAFDGILARASGKVSKLGELIDHTSDGIISIYLNILTYYYFREPWILIHIPIFFISLIIVSKVGIREHFFPPRAFIYLYILKLYKLGVFLNLFYIALGTASVYKSQYIDSKSN